MASHNGLEQDDQGMINVVETPHFLLNDSDLYSGKVDPSSGNLKELQAVTENVGAVQHGPALTIIQSKKMNDYKVYNQDKYLVADKNKCVFLDPSTWREGLKLVVSLRYKRLDHENKPVEACSNDSKEADPSATVCNDACFRLVCESAKKRVKYFRNYCHHPTAEVSLGRCEDELSVMFLCHSVCHRKYGKLMVLVLELHQESTGKLVCDEKFTVHVAANVKSRADDYYNQDIHKQAFSFRPSNRKRHDSEKELNDPSKSCKKKKNVDTSSESSIPLTIDQAVSVTMNECIITLSETKDGASTSGMPLVFHPLEETADSINGLHGSTAVLPASKQLESEDCTRQSGASGTGVECKGLIFPPSQGGAMQSCGLLGTQSKGDDVPMVSDIVSSKGAGMSSCPTKIIVVILSNHEKHSDIIKQVVELAGGTFTVHHLTDDGSRVPE